MTLELPSYQLVWMWWEALTGELKEVQAFVDYHGSINQSELAVIRSRWFEKRRDTHVYPAGRGEEIDEIISRMDHSELTMRRNRYLLQQHPGRYDWGGGARVDDEE